MKIPSLSTALILLTLAGAFTARGQFSTPSGPVLPSQINAAGSSQPLSSATPLPDVTDVLASAGTENFKVEDIRPYLAKLSAEQRAALAKDPQTLQRFVRTFLIQRLLIQEARNAKWDEQPDVIAQLQRIKENAIADGYLAEVAKIPDDFPSDADIRAAYEANKSSLVAPRKLRLAQVLIEAPKDPQTKAQDLAEARVALLVKDLKKPNADFLKTAKTRGEETQNAIRGGEVGWLAETQVPAEFRETVLKLPSGGVSDPIRLKEGWVIVKVLEIKEAAPVPLDDARPVLAQKLREVKARQLSEAYVKQLVEKNPITINESTLTGLLAPTTH